MFAASAAAQSATLKGPTPQQSFKSTPLTLGGPKDGPKDGPKGGQQDARLRAVCAEREGDWYGAWTPTGSSVSATYRAK